MITRRNSLFALAAAAVAVFGSASLVHAAKEKPVARGVVSKLDSAAKSFVVTNKKTGETAVSFDDKTVFKKAAEEAGQPATDASVSDLKDGAHVSVRGSLDGGKVKATEVTFGAKKKKAAPAAAPAAAAPAAK